MKDILHTLSRVAFQAGLLLFLILRMTFTRFPLNYSLKNIPMPSEMFYKKNRRVTASMQKEALFSQKSRPPKKES